MAGPKKFVGKFLMIVFMVILASIGSTKGQLIICFYRDPYCYNPYLAVAPKSKVKIHGGPPQHE